MSDLTFDVGLASKLKQAVIRNGIGDLADIDWLCDGENLLKVRRLRQGHVALTVPEHIIDCDADPFVPDGWSVEEHRKRGAFKFKWNAANVSLHLDKSQQNGKWIVGNKLREVLAGKPVLNANVLDYLLANPHLIPEEWKGSAIFFWGTIYRDRDGDLGVRYLVWRVGRWRSYFRWLGLDWGGSDPALRFRKLNFAT